MAARSHHLDEITDYVALIREHGSLRRAAAAVGTSAATLFRRQQDQLRALEAAGAERKARKAARQKVGARQAGAVQPPVSEIKAKVPGKKAEKVEKPVSGGVIHAPDVGMSSRSGRRFILSAAQNNTDVLPGFLDALRHLATDVGGAEILISPLSYNTTGWSQPHKATKLDEENADLWYDDSLQPYLCRESTVIAPGLIFCGELDVSPTAVDPLSGLESYTRDCSGVVPHTKVSMKSLPTMKHDAARFLYTTGCVTQRNYIARKAGQKASFHHVYGALLIEVDDDGAWFVRQLVASEDGSFHDLNRFYDADGAHDGDVEAAEWGDIHVEKSDPETIDAVFGRRGILDTLCPRVQFFNDLIDQSPRNHHNLGDPHWRAAQHFAKRERVQDAVRQSADLLALASRPWTESVVKKGNHDEAVPKWLREADGHRDPPNARYWHAWNAKVFEAIERQDSGYDVFADMVMAEAAEAGHDLSRVRFLAADESYVICEDQGGGIECGMHGHLGPNGARASPKSFRSLGRRANTAHSHSAGIVDGVYTAGVTGSLDMGYNRGPSSWSQSHVVTYPSGKRAIITMRGVRWRGQPVARRRRNAS